MTSFLLSGTKVQVEICWLPGRYVHKYRTHGYFNTLVVVIVYRHHRWIGLSSFPPLETCMAPFATMKVSPHGEGIQFSSSLGASEPYF